MHLPYQIGRRRESLLVADKTNEGDVNRLAVEIAGEIEQKDFKQHRPVVEGRPPAETRHGVVAPAADGDADRIDAVTQTAGRIERQIRGRKAELAAALIAVDHLARHEPGKAEQ